MPADGDNSPAPKRRRLTIVSSRSEPLYLQTDAEVPQIDDPFYSTERTTRDAPLQTTSSLEVQIERFSQISVNNDDNETPNSLEVECSKRPCLDGKFFGVCIEESDMNGTILAECQICTPKKRIKTSLRTTSNLTTHLKRKHPTEFAEYKVYAGSKKRPTNIDRKKWSCTFSQEVFETNVTAFVLGSMSPLSTVEDKLFRKIIDDINIKKEEMTVSHLTRHTLLLRINGLAEQQIMEINEIMKTTEYVCTTADAWSGKKRRFLGVTLHWIDEKTLDRKSAAIACKRFPGTHSHDAIAKNLIAIHATMNIGEKIVATVTDNGSNFVKAFKEYGIDALEIPLQGAPSASLPDNEEAEVLSEIAAEDPASTVEGFSNECGKQLPKHLRCASHTLNLIATTDTAKAIAGLSYLADIHSNVMAKCNCVWKSLRSPKASEALKNYLGICLKRPVVTRWNSLFDSVQQLVSCKAKLLRRRALDEIDVVFREPLTSADFSYLEEYLLCTRDLAKSIDLLQGETYCHYGYLLPTLVQLRRQLQLLADNDTIMDCRPIVEATVQGLETRFKQMFEITGEGKAAAIAAMAHPKFKIRWLRCLPAAQQKLAYDSLVDALSAEAEGNIPANAGTSAAADDWDFGNNPTIFENIQSSVNHATSEVEVTQYLQDPDNELSMLNRYPVMRKVFRKYNTPLPSSAPVERLFSYATMLDLPKYNRLNDKNFETRVLAKVNASKNYE